MFKSEFMKIYVANTQWLAFKIQEVASYYNKLKSMNAKGLAKGAGFTLNS